MKKIVALALVIAVFALTLASCGSGGDTKMHKIMEAAEDNIITRDDIYEYKSIAGFQSTDNEDYTEVRALCNGVNPGVLVGFSASDLKVVKDTSKNDTSLNITWWAEDSDVTYESQSVSVLANTISMEVEYTTRHWDSARGEWMTDTTYKALVYGLNMDDYYQNGSFSAEGVTTVGDSECTAVAVSLLNDAFGGLNGVFTAKGYPIK